ncbi:glycosyltransferase [Niabella hirudinis]|uniref:glycosyltransferase n=1 Tax=Niabella hirudinis TaxID=1285929 RepID=UPI003EB8D314
MRKIIHVIETLGVGGAETLLVNTVNALEGVEQIVLFLTFPDTLQDAFKKEVSIICLNHKKGIRSLCTIGKIRNIVRRERPDIVHAHLLGPMLYCRLALPKGIKLVSTIHSILSIDAYRHNPSMRRLDRLLHKKGEVIIGVSKSVLDDYDHEVGIKGGSAVLYNFVSEAFFEVQWNPRKAIEYPIKLVAIGNLRAAKNHRFLLDSFAKLPKGKFSLDIYGEGPLKEALQRIIDKEELNVCLKGSVNAVEKVLLNYDAYVMSSTLEGHSIAVAEAMAVGIPMILSKIPTLVEGSFGYASFFDLDDSLSLTKLLLDFEDIYEDMKKNAAQAKEIAFINYQKGAYVKKLLGVYTDALKTAK